MSKISLKHSGGKVVSLNSPTTEPNANDVAFKLPNQDGSANEFLKTDGSGNLSFGAAGGGKFASYAVITDVKSANASGGTFTAGDWRTRDLNTETTDEDGIVSISSNQFTLGAGSYLIQYFAPADQCNSHQARLYNITDSSEVSLGSTEYAGTGSNMSQTTSYGFVRLTLSGSKVFELQHRCSSTINNYGFGVGSQGGFSWGTTKYATVVIYKEA
tara:strand:- start:241 stop:885 length:645 start_codon:yes stop_codon:yes gene_type:complete